MSEQEAAVRRKEALKFPAYLFATVPAGIRHEMPWCGAADHNDVRARVCVWRRTYGTRYHREIIR